ncbi:hypothetical protein V7128_29810 [Neobacillus vireti]|uniref:hypothetical protein n=1 Tax=Neobacillus vireti TaxID=220686 RepID=UPI002FFFACA9
MKMNNKKSYAIMPNVAFAFGTRYHLNKDEFMLFAHLQFMKQVGGENTTFTMVDMLVRGLEWETSTKSRDKKRVVEALAGLESKGYISIDFNGKMSKDILNIFINKEMERFEATSSVDWKEKPFSFKGFTRIEWNEYNLAEQNGYYLMIITYVKWRTNPDLKYDYKICIREWENVLNVSDKTARDRLEECHRFITKISGDHYLDDHGQVKQEANRYTMQTVTVESNIQKITNEAVAEKALDKAFEKVTDIEIKTNINLFNQIFDKKTKWKFDGYKAWKETTCPFVKEGGQKKIDSMYKSSNKIACEVADRLEREYQEYLSKQKQQSEWLDRQMASMDEHEAYVPSYVPNPCNDITDFLDD